MYSGYDARETDDSCVEVEYKQVQDLAQKQMKEDN